jgi:alcohol dehydrogenase class IV
LLSTPRAADSAPLVVQGAGVVLEVAAGHVDELAAQLRPRVAGELLVALGGGRVVDVAKALAAADPPRRVAAIPTTLSGAEMTAVHRHAAGVAGERPRVRPAIVVNDPALSASQPIAELAASAANALGHAAEGPLTPLASPVPALAAMEATRLIVGALPGVGAAPGAEPDRDALALGALLAGYVIGSTGYGLHHVLAQTLVRFAGISHGTANAVMLPHSLPALSRRSPVALERFGEAMGGDPALVAARVCALSGVTRLRDAGVSVETLDLCAAEAAGRPELSLTPRAAQEAELRELYGAAW